MAGFGVKVKDKDFRKLVTTIKGSGRYIEERIESTGPEIAMAASAMILNAIRTQMSNPQIGAFMAPRTKITPIISGHTVVLEIEGKTEGEAGHPPRSDGSIPKVKNNDVNLWITHEFGVPSDGASGTFTYEKDVGGVTAQRTVRGHGVGSPYVGEIRRIITGMTDAISQVAMTVAGIAAVSAVADVVSAGTGGKVKLDKSAKAALSALNINPALLATYGINQAFVSSRGQINYLGSTGAGNYKTFVSGKRFGLPTTINR